MKVLDRMVGSAIVLVYVPLVGVVATQVLIRYFIGGSLVWSEEAVRFLFIWLCFLGAVAVAERGGHIAVSVLVDILPPGLKRVVVLGADLVVVSFLCVLVWQGVLLVEKTWSMPSPTALLPMGIVYAAVPVSAGLMLLCWVAKIFGRPHDASGSGSTAALE